MVVSVRNTAASGPYDTRKEALTQEPLYAPGADHFGVIALPGRALSFPNCAAK
jgi:hypothetical protein